MTRSSPSSCSNIRIAEQRIGDIRAQAAALKVGETRLRELIARYGRETVERGDRRDARARRAAHARRDRGRFPTASIASEAFVDFGRRRERAAAGSRSTRDEGGRHAHFDSRGSSPALPRADELGCGDDLFGRLSRRAPHLPGHADQRRRLRAADRHRRPEGTFLDARYPRPVSGCAAEVSQRIAEAVFLALVQAIPDKL